MYTLFNYNNITMANQIKVNEIGFDIEAVSKLENIEAFKAQGALEHLPEAEANAIYDEVWKQASEFKPKSPVLTVVKPKKAKAIAE